MLSMPTPGALELLPLEPAGGDLRMLRPRSLAVKTILAARRTIRMDAVERPEWRWILVRLCCTTRKSVVSTFPGNRSSSAGKVKSNGNVALPRKAIHVGAQSRRQPPILEHWRMQQVGKPPKLTNTILGQRLALRERAAPPVHRVCRLSHAQLPGSSPERQYVGSAVVKFAS